MDAHRCCIMNWDIRTTANRYEAVAHPEFLSIKGAVAFCDNAVSRSLIYQAIQRGELKSINLRKPGTIRGRRIIPVVELRSWLMSYAVLPSGVSRKDFVAEIGRYIP